MQRSFKKILIFVLLAVGIAFAGFFVIRSNILFGDDKIAYDMLVDFIYDFKDPSSVRLVSGSLYTDDGLPRLYCGISAVNGFGGRSTSYYVFRTYGNGTVGVKEYPNGIDYDIYTTRDALNIKLINKHLAKVFGI